MKPASSVRTLKSSIATVLLAGAPLSVPAQGWQPQCPMEIIVSCAPGCGPDRYRCAGDNGIPAAHALGSGGIHSIDMTRMAMLFGEYSGLAVRMDAPIAPGPDLIERLRKDPAAHSVRTASRVCNSNHQRVAGALSGALHPGAQEYPSKPVRIIAPSPATTADFLARLIGRKLNEQWGKPVIVENRTGAPSAMMPAITVAKATPDGYSLLMGETSSLATAVSLFKKLEYDPSLDFAPITLVARAPFVLIVNPSTPASDLRQFIAYAKERPRALSYATASSGSTSHLTTGLFVQLTGIEAVHVPYKNAGAATLAIVAGEVPFAAIALSSAMPQIKAARVRALAVTSKQRFAPIANIPTAAEAGLTGFESEVWYGILAPARTAAALVSRLNRDVVSILHEPTTQQALVTQGAEPQPSTPDEFVQFIQTETAKWRRVIKAAGMSLQ